MIPVLSSVTAYSELRGSTVSQSDYVTVLYVTTHVSLCLTFKEITVDHHTT